MEPSRPRNKLDHIMESADVLKTAVFFGGNAAGKSNIIKALRFLKNIAINGVVPKPDDGYYCKADPSNKERPIRLEIDILRENPQGDASKKIDALYHGSYELMSQLNECRPEHWTQYRYVLELQNIGNSLPYNISVESISKIISGKESVIKDYGIDVSRCMDKISEELKMRELEIMDLKRKSDENLKTLSQHYVNIDVLDHKIAEINQKKETCEIMIEKIKIDKKNGNKYDESEESALIRRLDELSKELKETQQKKDNEERDSETCLKTIVETERKLADASKSYQQSKTESVKARRKASLDINSIPELYKNSITLTSGQSKYSKWEERSILSDIHDWFANTLFIVDISDRIPLINGFDDFSKINELLPMFDARISGLDYVVLTDQSEIDTLFQRIGPKKMEKLYEKMKSGIGNNHSFKMMVPSGANLFEFCYANSKMEIRKLVTVHKDGTKHQLMEESDGTRRLVELISALIKPNSNKVFVIDELDRRLHPLITRNFINTFYKNNADDVQLIISTHESRLATTDMFRLDEINFVQHDENYCTHVKRAKDVVKSHDKPIDEMYLEGILMGTPNIG